MRPKSVFGRLYLLFGICIAVIYICMIAVFLKYAQMQREQEIDRLESGIGQSVSLLEQQLETIYGLEQTLVTDSRIKTLAYEEISFYDRSQLRMSLVGHLKSLKSMNQMVEDIWLLFPKQETCLSASGGYRRMDYTALNREDAVRASMLTLSEGQVCMELLYPLTFSTEEEYLPDYGVRIILSEDWLEHFLGLLGGGESAEYFYVLEHMGGQYLPGREDQTEALYQAWRAAWEKAGAEERFSGTLRCGGLRCLSVSRQLPQYGITVTVCSDMGRIDQMTGKTLLFMGVLLLFIGGLFFFVLLRTNVAVNRPLQEVVGAFGEVQKGNLDIRIFHEPQDEFGYIYASFNRMVERIVTLIENVKEQGRLLQNAELMQLQSQINPHFLYNSFYLIRIMAKNESYEQIIPFVTSLAKYYRFLNKETEQNIPLLREAEHMENYIEIQQMRFGDKITVDRGELPQEASDFKVPKLILQPVVENAYNYGVKNMLEGGKIRIRYELDGKWLLIEIGDNGSGGSDEMLRVMRENIADYKGRSAGHALSNIDRRLKLAFGEECGIFLMKSGMGGLTVRLKMDTTVQLSS